MSLSRRDLMLRLFGAAGLLVVPAPVKYFIIGDPAAKLLLPNLDLQTLSLQQTLFLHRVSAGPFIRRLSAEIVYNHYWMSGEVWAVERWA